MSHRKSDASADTRARMIPISGFCGPFYPVKRVVREENFFSSLKPERQKGGFKGFSGFGIPVRTPLDEYCPVTAQFRTKRQGDIWVMCPGPGNILVVFPPFYIRGCVSPWEIDRVADQLRRELNNAAARARRKAAKKSKKKKG